MSRLKTFTDLGEKEKSFANRTNFLIDTKQKFDSWFNYYVDIKGEDRTNYIFRGMKDAKHHLYTSAQRQWLENDMSDWYIGNYLQFINELVKKAKEHPLIKKVFDVHDYSDTQRDFPILSILQHYGAPTPLMDWTYNINVALFFATENQKGGHGTDTIDDFFSIYCIKKDTYKRELLSLDDFDAIHSTSLMSFEGWQEDARNPNQNGIFYLSDFENGNVDITHFNDIQIRTNHPLTTVYNQNIIPQEGLFIFNPYANKTIDEVFNVKPHSEGSNLVLSPFDCFNIKKDLSDYVVRRIKQHQDIDSRFIYPELRKDSHDILNQTLNSFV